MTAKETCDDCGHTIDAHQMGFCRNEQCPCAVAAERDTLKAGNVLLVDVIRCAIVDLSDAAAMYGGSDGRPDMLHKVMLDNAKALKQALGEE